MLKSATRQRAVISVRGVVQGVGFRPFVYRLAAAHHLSGWVRNTSGKVEIEVEGGKTAIRDFLEELPSTSPPDGPHRRYPNKILYSCRVTPISAFRKASLKPISINWFPRTLPPVPSAVRRFSTLSNRRYRYPFTNCTNCGPRFTIIEDIPYDRPNTTMRDFKMCPRCQQRIR